MLQIALNVVSLNRRLLGCYSAGKGGEEESQKALKPCGRRRPNSFFTTKKNFHARKKSRTRPFLINFTAALEHVVWGLCLVMPPFHRQWEKNIGNMIVSGLTSSNTSWWSSSFSCLKARMPSVHFQDHLYLQSFIHKWTYMSFRTSAQWSIKQWHRWDVNCKAAVSAGDERYEGRTCLSWCDIWKAENSWHTLRHCG